MYRQERVYLYWPANERHFAIKEIISPDNDDCPKIIWNDGTETDDWTIDDINKRKFDQQKHFS